MGGPPAPAAASPLSENYANFALALAQLIASAKIVFC